MDMKQIGKNIAGLRKEKGYTQEALAEKLGISPQAVSKWETGIGLPEAALLLALSELLHVTIDEILQPENRQNRMADFFNRNMPAPAGKILQHLPKIDRWNPPPGCDMYYSMPAMVAEALCCIEAREGGRPESVTLEQINDRFRDLMHIMGVGYGFLWFEKRHLIEELWRINEPEDMMNRAMRYYGRDYLWLTPQNASGEEMQRAVLWSIDRGHPVVMEWAGGIPEYSIVAGYEERGKCLIGWTYCSECAAKTNEQGMFVNPARWEEALPFRVLIIGDAIPPSYSDRDSMHYALETLNRNQPGGWSKAAHEALTGDRWAVAGEDALQKWLEACDTEQHTIQLLTVADIFTHALYQNTMYTQKCLLSYYKKLGARSPTRVNDVVNQISIAVIQLENSWNGIGKQKKKPTEQAKACRRHIETILQHRQSMRGWVTDLAERL